MESNSIDILIIDDNLQDCMLLQKTIASIKIRTNVTTVHTITEAMNICNSNNFDCIF